MKKIADLNWQEFTHLTNDGDSWPLSPENVSELLNTPVDEMAEFGITKGAGVPSVVQIPGSLTANLSYLEDAVRIEVFCGRPHLFWGDQKFALESRKFGGHVCIYLQRREVFIGV
jgi:hypothetical protein